MEAEEIDSIVTFACDFVWASGYRLPPVHCDLISFGVWRGILNSRVKKSFAVAFQILTIR
jgi:hypothetical protein